MSEQPLTAFEAVRPPDCAACQHEWSSHGPGLCWISGCGCAEYAIPAAARAGDEGLAVDDDGNVICNLSYLCPHHRGRYARRTKKAGE